MVKRIFICLMSLILFSGSLTGYVFAADDARVKIAGIETGSIFFDDEIPVFKITVKNFSPYQKIYTLVCEIEKNELSGDASTVLSQEKELTLKGGESIVETVEYNAEEYGLYKLKAYVLDEADNIIHEESLEFSKVMRNEVQNPYHGVCIHLVRMGDADTELRLAKNAGFSMVRDDFTWSEYETSKNDRKLSVRQAELLDKTEKYNLELLAIVGGDNSAYNEYYDISKPSLPVDMEAFADFVENLITEDKFGNVKKIELQNEPQAKYIIEGGEYYYGQQNTDKLGEQYAKQMIAAGEVIRNIRPDIEIGALSLCLTGQAATDDFINSVYDYFDQTYEGSLPFDTVTIHPYTKRDGKNIGETVEHYKDVAAGKGFDKENTDVWCTEYGIATSSTVTQTQQAVYILKCYAEMKSKRYTDDVYVYDMADENGSYSLVKYNAKNGTPYVAKLAYPAVSALNKITGDAKECTEIENESAEIYKFSGKSGDAYLIFPGDASLAYDFGEGNVRYYDMLGNKVDMAESEDFYAEGLPYYVTVNKAILPAEKDAFTVSGNTAEKTEGRNISVTVLKSDASFDGSMINEIQYAEQKKTEADGYFEFNFDVPDKTENLTAYVVSEGSEEPLMFNLEGLKALKLYSGVTEVNSLGFDLSEASVRINFKDVIDREKYQLICGFYKDGQLVYSEMRSGTDAGDVEVYDISVNEVFDYDTVKMFLFDSVIGCRPLCDATVID